ncbi:hypothetical protein HZC09_06950 [Candidatus Micrarchaeota archaeon]|nr:hypothetical protein [Candidatus Micrarchaeota archaeon]
MTAHRHIIGGYVIWFRICRVLTLLLLIGVTWDPVPGFLTTVMKNDAAVVLVFAALLTMTVILTYDFLTRTQRDWKQLIGKYLFLLIAIILLFGMFYVFLETHTTDSGLRSQYRYTPERDAFYYSATTYFMVGLGDYSPYGAAKTLTAIEAAIGNVVNLVVLAIALTRLKPAVQQQ